MKVSIILTILGLTSALKVHRSTTTIPNKKVSGLHLQNELEQVTYSNSLTACTRFNYHSFGKSGSGRYANIFQFPNPKTTRSFFYLSAEYLGTWLHFGRYDKNASSNWVVREPYDLEYKTIWIINTWHHVCFAFNHKKSSVVLVKVTFIHQSSKSTYAHKA